MNIHWEQMFIPTNSLLEVVIRGACVYAGLFLLFRVILKRQSGDHATSDLLLVVLIADAVQNGMAGNYLSITEALTLGATLMACDYFVDWLEFKFPKFSRMMLPDPLILVKEGRMFPRNMRKELISRRDLMQSLREKGVDDVNDVKIARIENNGQITVIPK